MRTMQLNPPVLMPVWMIIVAIIGLVLVAAWLLRSLLVTRRDRSREVGDIPMAPSERNRWSDRVEAAQERFAAGEIDPRGLHLELASVLRGFAAARSGEDITPATVREILDMSDPAGPIDVEDRLELVRRHRRPLYPTPLGYVRELLAVWAQPPILRDPEAAAAGGGGRGPRGGEPVSEAPGHGSCTVATWSTRRPRPRCAAVR